VKGPVGGVAGAAAAAWPPRWVRQEGFGEHRSAGEGASATWRFCGRSGSWREILQEFEFEKQAAEHPPGGSWAYLIHARFPSARKKRQGQEKLVFMTDRSFLE